ncbi:MAG: N-acetyltransferase [Aquabacterium sp.]|jgi:predicted GNAT family N-acyltransferase|nr:MAG: N-acetyltransferase [Aquabacterium sp.]
MRLIEQLSPAYRDQLHQLYLQAWWALDRTPEQAERCLAGSQLTIGIVDDDGRLVGFTRVLTDYIFKALIFDVIVDREQRGRGLGERLISHVKSHPELSRVRHFELYCKEEVHDFYVAHDFIGQAGDLQLMRYTAR